MDKNGYCEVSYDKYGLLNFGLNEHQAQVVKELRESGTIDEDSLPKEDLLSIGLCYYYGFLLEKDLAQAIYFYERAANKGSSTAECNLAKCYEYHLRNFRMAVYWLRQAAKHGNPDAQRELAEMSADKELASELLEKSIAGAIEHKDAVLLNYLGDRFWRGDTGIRKSSEGLYYVDRNRAVQLYTLAAELGNPLAMMNLVVRMENGEIEGSKERILELIESAAASGFRGAIDRLEQNKNKEEVCSKE